MSFPELRARAEARALELKGTAGQAAEPALQRLRTDLAGFFERLPEPPLYRRATTAPRGKPPGDELLSEGSELLARCLALAEESVVQPQLGPLTAALEAHLESLCQVRAGAVTAAEASWLKAHRLARRALSAQRLWFRSDENLPPVFDRASRRSRYDPRPATALEVSLTCPARECRALERYALQPQVATQRLVCPRCRRPFLAHVGEARSVVRQRSAGAGPTRYELRLDTLGTARSRVEFVEQSGAEFSMAHGDMVACLYTTDRQLQGVLNLSSARVLWLQRSGACFVATAAFGPDAAELEAFRAFRDEALLPHPVGRRFVRLYYRLGPAAAALVERCPGVKVPLRRALERLHRRLIAAGYGAPLSRTVPGERAGNGRGEGEVSEP